MKAINKKQLKNMILEVFNMEKYKHELSNKLSEISNLILKWKKEEDLDRWYDYIDELADIISDIKILTDKTAEEQWGEYESSINGKKHYNVTQNKWV